MIQKKNGFISGASQRHGELTKGQTRAEGCASLLHLATRFSLRFALYTSFSPRSTLSAPYRFLSPLLAPSQPLAFTYVRPIQMAKVNFAITKYLARKSLRYGATHHFGAAATIHGRETPLGLSRRERDPPPTPSRNPNAPAGPEGHPELTSPNQLRARY